MLKFLLKRIRRVLPQRLDCSEESRWVLWRWKYIRDHQGEDYLTRLTLLKTPLFSVRLHWIHVADWARDAHDHPWNFISLVLSGGYMETESEFDASNGKRTRRATRAVNRFSLNYKSLHVSHCITGVYPDTVTLFLTGRWQEPWGFWVPTGISSSQGHEIFCWVEANEYHASMVPQEAAAD